MDFMLTGEQRQLADALRRWVGNNYGFQIRHQVVHSERGVSEQHWGALTELGIMALPIPEQHGGFNGSAVDMMVVMQELGRGMVVEPYFATMMGAAFLKASGGHGALLEQVAGGQLKLACALGERQSRHDLSNIITTARPDAGAYLIDGAKTVVLHGAQADCLIVSARAGGLPCDTAGISLFAVPADTPGITRKDYRTVDGMRAADIRFDNVRVPAAAMLGVAGAGWELLDAVVDYGTALLCAEAVGVMEEMQSATLEHLKTRQQFGVALGKFQSLQHRMADMFMQLEQSRSMAIYAALKAGSADPHERRYGVSAAKARIGQALRFVGEQAVHLHGGLGVTDELPLAHYFKRASMIELTLGDVDHHLARLTAQPGFKPTA